MNAKNIKKSLSATLDKWLEHVENEEIKKIVKGNSIITGGALVSMLTGEDGHDYDVYFRTREACLKVAEYYVGLFNAAHGTAHRVESLEDGRVRIFVKSKGIDAEEGESGITDETESISEESAAEGDVAEKPDRPKYRPVFLSTNAISLANKIQLVVRFWGEPSDIHTNYDFVHCTCAWSSWDNELSLPPKALEAIINKELFYVGSKYPLCSIIRTRKFLSRGWHINAGQYLKMALQLNELDLKNLNTFEDQLVGVDSAYFAAAIERIKERKEKEPDFKIDNSYLFEIINRIF